MTEHQLKTTLGVTLIIAHFFIVLLCIVIFVLHGFSFDQLTTSLAIIIPMFAGYTSSVTLFIVNSRRKFSVKSHQITTLYAVMSFAFPVAFTVLLAGAILAQGYNNLFSDFEQFKTALVIIEGIFAVYIGRFVYSMFERPPEDVAEAAEKATLPAK